LTRQSREEKVLKKIPQKMKDGWGTRKGSLSPAGQRGGESGEKEQGPGGAKAPGNEKITVEHLEARIAFWKEKEKRSKKQEEQGDPSPNRYRKANPKKNITKEDICVKSNTIFH